MQPRVLRCYPTRGLFMVGLARACSRPTWRSSWAPSAASLVSTSPRNGMRVRLLLPLGCSLYRLSCTKCVHKKFNDEEVESCPVCNIDLACTPLEKLRTI